MFDVRNQVVAGVVPPELGEALIREVWPSVAARSGVASLGKALICSIVLAPLGWLLMAPFYFLKILPFIAERYTLTNRRLMVRRGLKSEPSKEVPLADIDDVRVIHDANSEFYRAGDIEVVSKGAVVLKLQGVPEAESFRHGILQACRAWAPAKAADLPFVAAKETTGGQPAGAKS